MTPVNGVSQYLQELSAISPVSAVRAGALPADKKQGLKVVTQEFESMFITELLKAAGRTDLSAGLFGNDRAMQMYKDMHYESVAANMASAGGMGLGDMLFKEMSKGI